MTLKELRKANNLTQAQCASYLGVPLRTYQNYETVAQKASSLKYLYMQQKLEKYNYIDEENGILTLQKIIEITKSILKDYNVEYCYLFGSYAKNKAKESSDIDLLIKTSISGLKYYEMTEKLREELKKKVDVLNFNQVTNNPDLLNEILKDGIKIYG